ncbi:MAG: N-acyl-D-amino-acid deacylase family protein [Pseudonocardia sp.]
MTFDVVVRNGTIADGTGAPLRVADVGISGDRVAAVGERLGRGTTEIDARGALVMPGWVDVHTHYDGQATWDAHLAPSAWHGVTTVVMGNCGVGFAPVHPHDHDRLVALMEGVEDIPGTALHEGLPWDWRSFPDYLDALARRRWDVDVAAQLPHAPLRVHVMGERGANREPATPDDIAAMARLAGEAVRAGALGFTTSRSLNHRTADGDPIATLTASADELAGIAAGMGGGVLQLLSDFVDLDAEWATVRGMVERSGRPLSFTVATVPDAFDGARRLLDRIAAARADGLPMTAQVAPRAIGLLFGFSCTLHPFAANPFWQRAGLGALTPAEQVAQLRRPDVRAALLDAHVDRFDPRNPLGGGLAARFDVMFEFADPPDYDPDPATNVAALAAARGVAPHELALDVLTADDDGTAMLYMPYFNFRPADGIGICRDMLRHPHAVPGLSDGGAHAGTICDASYPTFLLQHWGRDRGEFPIEWIVERQCRATARLVGLHDRGVLAPGYRADLNVVDVDRLALPRPEVHHDLPAGGRRLLQRAVGYRHTFVAGVETYRDGVATGAVPGRLVRGAQPAPA